MCVAIDRRIDRNLADERRIHARRKRSGAIVSKALPCRTLPCGSAMLTLAVLAFSVLAPATASAESPAVLRLSGSQLSQGRLLEHDNPREIRWQDPAFVRPLVFPISALRSIGFEPRPDAPPAAGQFGFQLIHGGTLFGNLQAIDENWLEVDTASQGRLRIRRDQVRSLFRWRDGQERSYVGPQRLETWNTYGSDWASDRVALTTDQRGAVALTDVQLPDRAAIDLHVKWNGTPKFVLAFGVDEAALQTHQKRLADRNDKLERMRENNVAFQADPLHRHDDPLSRTFHLTTIDGKLVLVYANGDSARLATLGPLPPVDQSLRLTILLDQRDGHAVVLDAAGRKRAELRPPFAWKSNPRSTFAMRNLRGGVTLESLTVRAVGKEVFSQSEATSGTIWIEQQGAVRGDLTAVDAESGRWTIAVGNEDREVDVQGVVRVLLNAPDTNRADTHDNSVAVDGDATGAIGESGSAPDDDVEGAAGTPDRAADEAASTIAVVMHNGTRWWGELQRIDATHLHLQTDTIEGKLALPIADIRSLNRGSAGKLETKTFETPIATLFAGETRLQGVLQPSSSLQSKSPLVFEPLATAGPGELVLNHPTTISWNYVPPGKQAKPVAQATAKPNLKRRPIKVGGGNDPFGPALNVREMKAKPVAGQRPPKAPPAGAVAAEPKHLLYLRSGDMIECELNAIEDPQGVTVRLADDKKVRVPHDEVRAVVLAQPSSVLEDGEKKTRLLTVPRMRRKNPPTHLIVSIDGDYLRGRLQRASADDMVIQTRLDKQRIRLDYVAQIIWLHEDEIEPAADPKGEPQSDPDVPADSEANVGTWEDEKSKAKRTGDGWVQVVRKNGLRMSFSPRETTAAGLIGVHPILGQTRVSLDSVQRLLLGPAVESEAAMLPFADWRLRHAPDPLVFQEEDAGMAGTAGKQSDLVGAPAPDFELSLLDGKKYVLAEQRGQVVVLDFWASWCGPCMQAMPQLDALVEALSDKDLQLVAVNLQESQTRIEGALERLKIAPLVAMDATGDVAERYGATAIPQTVIIDREGNVTHVFVGGGARVLEQIRQALETSLGKAAEAAEAADS